MGTSYSKIYNLFLKKITAFFKENLNDEELESFCFDFFISAIVKVKPLKNNLEDRDDTLFKFNKQILDVECEIIACQMVIEWVDSKIATDSLLHLFIGTKEERMASQANHIRALMDLKDRYRAEINRLRRDYKYQEWINE